LIDKVAPKNNRPIGCAEAREAWRPGAPLLTARWAGAGLALAF
jgi:hypothetical protein